MHMLDMMKWEMGKRREDRKKERKEGTEVITDIPHILHRLIALI